MAYEIEWMPKAALTMADLDKETKIRIIKKVEELKLAPYHFAERLTNSNCWKLRIGDYRVIMDIIEEKRLVQILMVGHRKNIYK